MVVGSCLVLALAMTVSAYYGMTSDQLMLKQSLNELMGSRLSRLERRLQGTSRVRARSGHQILIGTFHALFLSITPPHSLLAQGDGQNIKKRRVTFLDKKYIAAKTYLSINEESLTKQKRGLEVILSTGTAKSN